MEGRSIVGLTGGRARGSTGGRLFGSVPRPPAAAGVLLASRQGGARSAVEAKLGTDERGHCVLGLGESARTGTPARYLRPRRATHWLHTVT